jgi:hypothetical protein
MAEKLTKIYVLRQLGRWKTVGELLHNSGNGGDEEAKKDLEKMLGALENEEVVFSYPRSMSQNVNYILSNKMTKEERDLYKKYDSRKAA